MLTFEEVAAAPSRPADARISYGALPLQFGEIRLPAAGPSRVPLVVLLHGGCWQSAYDLAHTAPAATALTREGWAVWTPEYRRLGDDGGGWPGTFDDIASAVDFVRELSTRYPVIDTTRVVLMGHSAGGQLALWAASRKAGDATALVARAPLHIHGVVALAAISDLATYGAQGGGCNSAVTPLLGGTPATVPARYATVSPTEHPPLGVTVRLVHGTDDPIVPIEQSRAFTRLFNSLGGLAVLGEVPGAGHFDVIAPQAEAWSAVLAAVAALKE